MAIIVYNTNIEDYTNKKNNFYIGRPSILGNPFTHDGKRSNLAKLSFRTREEALEAYKMYFYEMMEGDDDFKNAFNEIYEAYKSGEDVYLQCFCKPLKCHGDFLKEEMQKRLVKEKIEERKKALKT